MIHHLYVGHFQRHDGLMKLEKRASDGRPRPVLVRPLDSVVVCELLHDFGVTNNNIPDDWWLGIEEEGFIVCDRHTNNRDAIHFIRELAKKTGCDIFYDGMLRIPPDELTFAWDKFEGRVAP